MVRPNTRARVFKSVVKWSEARANLFGNELRPFQAAK
jgi:hypothetical protein